MQKISGVHFFCFRPEKPFWGKSGQKNQNRQFKLKFGTKTNLNMQNYVENIWCSLSCFRPEKQFLDKSGQTSQFKLKFRTKTNLNMQNSMMMFPFSVFEHKHLSWINLVQSKI